MFRNLRHLLTGGSIITLLAACSYGHTAAPAPSKKWTMDGQLANGQPVKVGMIAPTADWGCKQIGTQNYKWATMQFQGAFDFTTIGGGFTTIKKKAIAYANEQHLKPNYIHYTIPSTNELNGLNLTAISNNDRVYVTYYNCKKVDA